MDGQRADVVRQFIDDSIRVIVYAVLKNVQLKNGCPREVLTRMHVQYALAMSLTS